MIFQVINPYTEVVTKGMEFFYKQHTYGHYHMYFMRIYTPIRELVIRPNKCGTKAHFPITECSNCNMVKVAAKMILA
jgi:hypothetical protein